MRQSTVLKMQHKQHSGTAKTERINITPLKEVSNSNIPSVVLKLRRSPFYTIHVCVVSELRQSLILYKYVNTLFSLNLLVTGVDLTSWIEEAFGLSPGFNPSVFRRKRANVQSILKHIQRKSALWALATRHTAVCFCHNSQTNKP